MCSWVVVVFVAWFFFYYGYGDHRDLHLSIRRQRRLCIRDRSVTAKRSLQAAPCGRVPGSRRSTVVVQAKKTSDGPSIAIVGITGAVGQEFLQVRRAITLRRRRQGER